MRYLKEYKVFESVEQSEVEEIVKILQSKCLELNDREFITDIKPGIKYGHLYASLNKLNPYNGTLEINIEYEKGVFYFNQISVDVVDIIDFMGNEDWKLESILIRRISYSPIESKLVGDKLYGIYSEEEIDYQFDFLTIKFKSLR